MRRAFPRTDGGGCPRSLSSGPCPTVLLVVRGPGGASPAGSPHGRLFAVLACVVLPLHSPLSGQDSGIPSLVSGCPAPTQCIARGRAGGARVLLGRCTGSQVLMVGVRAVVGGRNYSRRPRCPRRHQQLKSLVFSMFSATPGSVSNRFSPSRELAFRAVALYCVYSQLRSMSLFGHGIQSICVVIPRGSFLCGLVRRTSMHRLSPPILVRACLVLVQPLLHCRQDGAEAESLSDCAVLCTHRMTSIQLQALKQHCDQGRIGGSLCLGVLPMFFLRTISGSCCCQVVSQPFNLCNYELLTNTIDSHARAHTPFFVDILPCESYFASVADYCGFFFILFGNAQ